MRPLWRRLLRLPARDSARVEQVFSPAGGATDGAADVPEPGDEARASEPAGSPEGPGFPEDGAPVGVLVSADRYDLAECPEVRRLRRPPGWSRAGDSALSVRAQRSGRPSSARDFVMPSSAGGSAMASSAAVRRVRRLRHRVSGRRVFHGDLCPVAHRGPVPGAAARLRMRRPIQATITTAAAIAAYSE